MHCSRLECVVFFPSIRCKYARAFQKWPKIFHIFLSLDATCVLVNILTNCAAPGICSAIGQTLVFKDMRFADNA